MSSRALARIKKELSRQESWRSHARVHGRDCRVHVVAAMRWCDSRTSGIPHKSRRQHGYWCPKCFEACPGCSGLRWTGWMNGYEKPAPEAVSPRSGDRMVFRRAAGKLLRIRA